MIHPTHKENDCIAIREVVFPAFVLPENQISIDMIKAKEIGRKVLGKIIY